MRDSTIYSAHIWDPLIRNLIKNRQRSFLRFEGHEIIKGRRKALARGVDKIKKKCKYHEVRLLGNHLLRKLA